MDEKYPNIKPTYNKPAYVQNKPVSNFAINKLQLWADCCEKLGYNFKVFKNTPEYTKVKQLYDEKLNQHMTPEQRMWKEACKECGFSFVSKDTPEYNAVKEIYKIKVGNANNNK